MKRDGALVSLWQSSVPDYESKYKQIPEADYDVVIVGAGITGITTALLLQQAGKKCIVIEAHNICFGTTGGTTAHLNTLLDTPYKQIIKNFGVENAKLVATAAADALLLIKENVEKFAINCGFENASAFLFAQNDDQVKELDELYEASLQAGLNISYADSLPIVTNFIKAVEVKGQAKFNPVLYVYTLAKAFEEAGGIIIQHCRVNNAEQNEKVDIETDQGKIKASALIYATHIPPGINLLHIQNEYLAGLGVVFVLGIAKIIDAGTGVNSVIIVTSTFWKFEFYTSVVLLGLRIPLAYILIQRYGIIGPAYAELISQIVYNFIRYEFLRRKFSMQPFNTETIYTVILGTAGIVLTYFGFHNTAGWLGIIIRSALFSSVLIGGMFLLKLTPDAMQLVDVARNRIQDWKK